jgi:hypothetical protein
MRTALRAPEAAKEQVKDTRVAPKAPPAETPIPAAKVEPAPPTPPATPVVTPTAPVVPPLVVPPATPPPVAAAKETRVADPYGPDARVNDATPAALQYVRGRVVVHTIADPPSADPGTGSIATQALYAMLQRRTGVSIVPLGVGFTSLAVAIDEGQRTQSRAVVMARIDGFALLTSGLLGEPPGVRMRLEVSVVRDGRLAMRRMVIAEALPSTVMMAGRHGRTSDPTYLAVQHGLEGIADDLGLALQPVMSDAR